VLIDCLRQRLRCWTFAIHTSLGMARPPPRRHMGILTMSQYEEPTDAVLAALNEWQMASWAAMDAAIDEANETPEWAEGTSPAVERWRNVVNSGRGQYSFSTSGHKSWICGHANLASCHPRAAA